jgi:hypothetical protein
MQNLMAALALGLAAVIIWRSWSTIMGRHSPAMAMRVRGKHQDQPIAAPVMPAPSAWFAPPSNPVLDLKAARVRNEPAAAPDPVTQIGRRGGWSGENDAELLRLLAEDMSSAKIAASLGRSEKSVELRIPLLRLRQRQAAKGASTG